MAAEPIPTVGLLLAAGSGERFGRPKATAVDADGTSWLRRSAIALRDGGCAEVLVVLGAGATEAMPLLDGLSVVRAVVAADWEDGLSASLRSGLRALGSLRALAVVTLVDLPDVGAAVVARMLDELPVSTGTLARATYDGRPGHPVLLGSDHWAPVSAGAHGDRGAGDYLAAHGGVVVECSDLATGRDRDRLDS